MYSFLINLLLFFSITNFSFQNNSDPFSDVSHSYSLPSFVVGTTDKPILYWTEKDEGNVSYLYFSTSKDGGKTFGDKNLIFSDAAMSSSRLMRPKLLIKKNGEMVAVFSYRITETIKVEPETMDHSNHSAPAQTTSKPKRSSQIKYTVSNDNGMTWSPIASVDNDESFLTRGFFDAVVLPNDEIAVSYLKDVKGSTKHEERDLRMAITKNGKFQDEKLLDAVVCDCCNISMLVDNKKTLHVFYRDNNDNIRDIAKMSSKDNGLTFGEPQTMYNDGWKINGCPHSGASSVATESGSLLTWFSGNEKTPGIRLVTNSGKLLTILNESSKNAQLASDGKKSIIIWEEAAKSGTKTIKYFKLDGEKLSGNNSELLESENGQNPATMMLNGKTIVAYEVAIPNQKTSLKVSFMN